MKNKTSVILIGILVSFILLLFFSVLQEKDAKFLNLSSQWILISIMPIILALFIGGYITKFKGFGVELEAALQESVSTSIELKAADAISEILGDEKQSMNYLEKMTREKALSIKWLVFVLGRTNYSTYDIREYFALLPNIEFLEVRTERGQFVCFIPIDYFKRKGESNQVEQFKMDKIHDFVNAIEDSNITEKFLGVAITVKVRSSDSLVQVLKTLRDEQVNMAAVISEKGRYLGVLFSQDVERKVADAVLKSQSA